MKTVKKVIAIAKKTIETAKREMSFQISLDRMKVELLKGSVKLEGSILRAQKELVSIAERRVFLVANGVKSLMNFQTLKDLYNEKLVHITLDVLVLESSVNAAKHIARAQGQVTKEQEQVIIDYYAFKAKESFQVITNVRELLENQGLLTKEVGKKAATKAPIKVEA